MINNIINDLKSLEGKEVGSGYFKHIYSNEVDVTTINILDVLESLKPYEFDTENLEILTYTEHEATTYKFGLRMYLLYLVYCLVILFSDKMYRFFKSKSFNTMYNLFFIAICLTLIFYNNFTVKRLIYYFTCFTPVIVSYFMFYLWKTKKRDLLFFTIIILLVQVIWSVYSDITQKGPFEPMLYKFDFN